MENKIDVNGAITISNGLKIPVIGLGAVSYTHLSDSYRQMTVICRFYQVRKNS